MATKNLATILKVTVWPVVVLVLVALFMFLFRSSIAEFINRWESFKMGDVEVKVQNEQDKKFLENVLAEREVYIQNLRQSIDSLARIIDTLEEENHQLVYQLEEVSTHMTRSEQRSTQELVERTNERMETSSSKAKNIEKKAATQFESLKAITSSENFKQSLKEVDNGFNLLLDEEYEEALHAFRKAEKLYPTLQKDKTPISVYIEKLLPDLRSDDKLTRKRAYAAMLREYSGRMPKGTKEKIEQIVLDKSP